MAQTQFNVPLPPPLDGRQEGTFTHYTITARWPAIVQNVLHENQWPDKVILQLEALHDELPDGPIRLLAPSRAVDDAAWKTYAQPYLGQSWLEAPWFFGETYFYRRILEATGYFEQEAGAGVDPFAQQKQQGLVNSIATTRILCTQLAALVESTQENGELLPHLLTIALWGNQADLSLSPTVAGAENPGGTSAHLTSGPAQQAEAQILANHADTVVAYLTGIDARTARIDIILDNAAFELICDLCLADWLLQHKQVATVVLHCKAHPTFVSDATIGDIQATVAFLAADADSTVQALATRLTTYLQVGQLQLQSDPFWTSPLSLWETPPHLTTQLERSDLLISKGDANYRRLLGDRNWSATTSFDTVVCYTPTPLLALRTLKSEVIIGLQPEQPAALNALDPAWLINGRWGVIQFSGYRATDGEMVK